MRAVRQKRRPDPRQMDLFSSTFTPLARGAPESARPSNFMDAGTMPREYQEAVAKSALGIGENGKPVSTLVVLPTGTGKTLIAVMAAGHKLKDGPVLFVAPTGPLARQQAAQFTEHIDVPSDSIATIIGDSAGPESRARTYSKNPSILVGTSQAVANDIEAGRIDISKISLVIIDECHHTVGNHSHNRVARAALAAEKPVLALTALPGDDYGKIETVMRNLGINNIEIYSRNDGAVARYLPEVMRVRKEVRLPRIFTHIRTRLTELSFDALVELEAMRMLPDSARGDPGLSEVMHASNVRAVSSLDDASRLMRYSRLDTIHSAILETVPGIRKKPYHLLNEKEKKAAHALSLHSELMFYYNLLNLFETQSISTALKSIEGTLRHVERTSGGRQANTEKSFRERIRANRKFLIMYEYLRDNYNQEMENPKLRIFNETLRQYPEKRFIVFTEFREQARLLASTAESLGAGASLLLGKSGGVSGKDQEKAIADFGLGATRILVSTRAGQEGLDLPEANVINYDQVSTGIASVQRTGRTGRSSNGMVIDLIALGTRDEFSYYRAARTRRSTEQTLRSVKRGSGSVPHLLE